MDDDKLQATLTQLAADFKHEIDGEDFLPTTVVLMIEGYDEDSIPSLSVVHTSDTPWKLIGLLEWQLAHMRDELTQ